MDEELRGRCPLDGPYEPMIVEPSETWDDPSLLLNWMPDNDPSYRHGFYQAAYSIAVGMANGTGPRSEALAYPMLWCFRQFVELSFKRIISIGIELDICDVAAINVRELGRHHVDVLWSYAEPILETVSFDEERHFFRRVTDIVGELQRLDPQSTAFRYATTQQGTPSLGSDHLVLRVNRLLDNMDVAMNWLSELISMLERRRRNQR